DQPHHRLPLALLLAEPARREGARLAGRVAVQVERGVDLRPRGRRALRAAASHGPRGEKRATADGPWLCFTSGEERLPADGVLEALARAEGGARGGTDLDLLAGARVTTGSSLALAGLEAPEAGDLHLVTALQRL